MLKLLDIMFPEKCLYCQKQGKYICDECYKKLNFKCTFQKTLGRYFDYLIFSSFYTGNLKRQIHHFKFHEKSYLYKYFIELSLKDERLIKFLEKFDFITYIPMSKNKELKRGYNQSKLLADELGKNLNKTVVKTLEKEENIKVQSSLNEKEREENAKHAFKISENLKLTGKNIILVDDIFTTGSTANSASKILKENNCNEICVFTIAKTKFNRFDF